MITKTLIEQKNLGIGFKRDDARKRFDVTLRDFVDEITTYLDDNGKLKSTGTLYTTLYPTAFRGKHLILNLDKMVYIGVDPRNTIHQDQERRLGLVRNHIGTTVIQFYTMIRDRGDTSGDVSETLSVLPNADNLHNLILDNKPRGQCQIVMRLTNPPMSSLMRDRIHESGTVATTPNPWTALKQELYIVPTTHRERTLVLSRTATRGPTNAQVGGKTAYEVIAKDSSLNISWKAWEVELRTTTPSAVLNAQNNREYTAGTGIAINNHRVSASILTNSQNALQATSDGKLFVPSVAPLLRLATGIVETTRTPTDVSLGRVTRFLIASHPTMQKPNIITPNATGGHSSETLGRIGRVKVTYTITEGKEMINDVKLMPNGLLADKLTADKEGFNNLLAVSTYNRMVSNFSYDASTGTISYEIANLNNWNPFTVMIAVEANTASVTVDQPKTIAATGDISALDAGVFAGRVYNIVQQGFSITYTRSGA